MSKNTGERDNTPPGKHIQRQNYYCAWLAHVHARTYYIRIPNLSDESTNDRSLSKRNHKTFFLTHSLTHIHSHIHDTTRTNQIRTPTKTHSMHSVSVYPGYMPVSFLLHVLMRTLFLPLSFIFLFLMFHRFHCCRFF